MYCGAHVERAHTHRLTDIQGKKSFTEAFNKQQRLAWRSYREVLTRFAGLEDDSDDSDTEIGLLSTIHFTAIADGAWLVVS